jgi:hypothetical protein
MFVNVRAVSRRGLTDYPVDLLTENSGELQAFVCPNVRKSGFGKVPFS